VFNAILDFLSNGVTGASAWQVVVFTLVVTHITIAAVTIFLHRCQAHRALDLHAIPSHFFRFWLWLTTGMVTKEWASIHRKHHAKCDTEEDPHSPVTRGIKKVFWEGAELYRAESKNLETMEKFGHGTPDDWIERNLYTKHSALGIVAMLFIDIMLFGVIGVSVWAVQMVWIPITAAGIINGIGHYWGYRNYDCNDAATNIIPFGITPSALPPNCRRSGTNSTSAGCISACWKSAAWPRSRKSRPRRNSTTPSWCRTWTRCNR
jgi:stearoyl-CoA desaturase (delta-9 desaturase)